MRNNANYAAELVFAFVCLKLEQFATEVFVCLKLEQFATEISTTCVANHASRDNNTKSVLN